MCSHELVQLENGMGSDRSTLKDIAVAVRSGFLHMQRSGGIAVATPKRPQVGVKSTFWGLCGLKILLRTTENTIELLAGRQTHKKTKNFALKQISADLKKGAQK